MSININVIIYIIYNVILVLPYNITYCMTGLRLHAKPHNKNAALLDGLMQSAQQSLVCKTVGGFIRLPRSSRAPAVKVETNIYIYTYRETADDMQHKQCRN